MTHPVSAGLLDLLCRSGKDRDPSVEPEGPWSWASPEPGLIPPPLSAARGQWQT